MGLLFKTCLQSLHEWSILNQSVSQSIIHAINQSCIITINTDISSNKTTEYKYLIILSILSCILNVALKEIRYILDGYI